jgi:Na+/H+ antiporter NhaD/arsenite permease-like protein
MAPSLALPTWTVLPFALLLLAIAILPLAAPQLWERNRNKGIVALLLALPVAVYLVAAHGSAGVHQLIERAKEYVSFIVLLASLFVVTGGIYVRGSLAGTPLVNTGVLGLGALLASWIGTTGASVLLIRPLLRANAARRHPAHIAVFFIFVVSNCGGLLTPLGDPPLFLGFLKGVPFTWTFRLWPGWLLVNGLLLGIFNVWDQRVLAREERERPGFQREALLRHEPLGVDGAQNFGFLAALVAVLYAAGNGAGNAGEPWPFGVQEGLMLFVTLSAWATTPGRIRRANGFGFAPIFEVAVLFAGLFVTMAPALLLLNANANHFGLSEPWQFFWAAGTLSSFLDNAPTYLTFVATACGQGGVALEGRYLAQYLALGPKAAETLAAISAGAVLMGANTYIGNGPNFLVKAIAEEGGVHMPSFFGYMAYSGAVLLPIFVLASLVLFRD